MEPYTIKLRKGKTYKRTVRWETMPVVFIAITAIENNAPALVTAPGHGLTDGWRAAISDVVGMPQINARDKPPRGPDWRRVTIVNSNQVTLDGLSAASFDTYESGGYLQYYTPSPLAGFRARMDIKDYVGGTILHSLFSDRDGNHIQVNNALKTVVFDIPADVSEVWDWYDAVYELEMVSSAEEVTTILHGPLRASDEVTTDD
jgi:hypothetical protein